MIGFITAKKLAKAIVNREGGNIMNSSMIMYALFLGVLCYFLRGKIPLIGNLPGDFSINMGDFRLFLPLTSSLLLSFIISFVKDILG